MTVYRRRLVVRGVRLGGVPKILLGQWFWKDVKNVDEDISMKVLVRRTRTFTQGQNFHSNIRRHILRLIADLKLKQEHKLNV